MNIREKRTTVKSITRNSKHRKDLQSCFYDSPLRAKGRGIFVGFIFLLLLLLFFIFFRVHMCECTYTYFHIFTRVVRGVLKGNNIKSKLRETISPPGTCGGPRHRQNKHQKGQ